MRFFLSVLVGGCVAVSAAHGQSSFGFGPRLGGNFSSATFSFPDQSTGGNGAVSSSRSAVLGFQVGLGATFGAGHWAVQPALVFTQRGVKQTSAATFNFMGSQFALSEVYTARVHYLELPVNTVYGLGANGEGFQLFAGPYLAMGVGGIVDYDLETTAPGQAPESISGRQAFAFGNTFAEPDPNSTADVFVDARARRFDAGLNAGVGYRKGPFQAQVGYGLGLLNVQPDYPASYQQPNDTGYHRNVQLTATYYVPAGGR